MAAVLKDVQSQHSVASNGLFTLSWSSGGPAAYAVSLNARCQIAGSFVAMSVFKPEQLPDLGATRGKSYHLLQSPKDFIPFRMVAQGIQAYRAGGRHRPVTARVQTERGAAQVGGGPENKDTASTGKGGEADAGRQALMAAGRPICRRERCEQARPSWVGVRCALSVEGWSLSASEMKTGEWFASVWRCFLAQDSTALRFHVPRVQKRGVLLRPHRSSTRSCLRELTGGVTGLGWSPVGPPGRERVGREQHRLAAT